MREEEVGGRYHVHTKKGGWCGRWRTHINVGGGERGVVRYENEAGQLSLCHVSLSHVLGGNVKLILILY